MYGLGRSEQYEQRGAFSMFSGRVARSLHCRPVGEWLARRASKPLVIWRSFEEDLSLQLTVISSSTSFCLLQVLSPRRKRKNLRQACIQAAPQDSYPPQPKTCTSLSFSHATLKLSFTEKCYLHIHQVAIAGYPSLNSLERGSNNNLKQKKKMNT